jgi:hypothetical protein
MERALRSLVRHRACREIHDPLSNATFLLHCTEDKMFVLQAEDGKEWEFSTRELDRLSHFFMPLYERFREDLNEYLDHLKEKGASWRFFDIAYGVQICVQYKKQAEIENGWQVWMGEDPSFFSENPEEVASYIRGLIVEFDSWLEQAFMAFHEMMRVSVRER